MNENQLRFNYFIIAYVIILLAYAINSGLYYNQTQLWLLVSSWIILLLAFLRKPWLNLSFRVSPTVLLTIANLIGFILFYFFDNGIYLISIEALRSVIALKFLALFLFSFYLLSLNLEGKNFFSAILMHFSKHKFVYLIILAFCLRLMIIFYSPEPKIDVFWFIDGGAKAFLQGKNPYSEVYFKVYEQPDYVNNTYAFWPATILITTFFKAIFGDIRFTYLLAQFGVALIIYFLVKKKFNQSSVLTELLVLLFLYTPLSLFVIEQSWTESLSLFFLYFFALLIIIDKKYLPYLVFGVFLAIKQLSLVFLFFLTKFKDISFKKYLLACLMFIIILAPFVVWSYGDFIQDTIITIIYYASNKVPLYSLTFNTLYKINFYTDIPAFIFLPLLLTLLAFLFFRTERDLPGILHSSLMFLLALFLIKQGFLNYYYSIAGGIILLIILEIDKLSAPASQREDFYVKRESLKDEENQIKKN